MKSYEICEFEASQAASRAFIRPRKSRAKFRNGIGQAHETRQACFQNSVEESAEEMHVTARRATVHAGSISCEFLLYILEGWKGLGCLLSICHPEDSMLRVEEVKCASCQKHSL